ncbi:DUF2254 domain-containing protein [Methanogenium marinum]|uniref:DUF2254 domain-containing protein n=1 Tax=Methanogenium marinum TaxID=348610 RepID=A0A9Q4KVF0_9EURY|nr:DUF2254 family protein [Methanogenium marinum]MDE4908181.1 DUF2254 domain-containing protein [Methanogenium marinum]
MSPPIHDYFLELLPANFDTMAILSLTATIVATMIALIFAISQILIQQSSTKFSIKVAEYFYKDRYLLISLSFGFSTIISSLIGIWVNFGPQYYAIIFVYFLIFLTSLIMYYFNFDSYLRADKIADRIKSSLQKCLNGNNNDGIDCFEKNSEILTEITKSCLRARDRESANNFIKSYISILRSLAINTKNTKIQNKERIKFVQIIYKNLYNIFEESIFEDSPVLDRYWIHFNEILHYSLDSNIKNETSKYVQTFTKLIIDSEQYNQYKREIHAFCYNSNINSISFSFESQINQIRYRDEIKELNYLINFKINTDINAKSEIESEIFEICDNINNNKDSNIQIETDKLIFNLSNLESTLIVHNLFFDVGSYLVYCIDIGKIDARSYLKELFDCTNPRTNMTNILNQPPIILDPFHLLCAYFYHGSGDKYYYVSPETSLYSNSFVDPIEYRQKFLLLSIGFCYLKKNNWTSIPHYSSNDKKEIADYFEFLELCLENSEAFHETIMEIETEKEYWYPLFGVEFYNIISELYSWNSLLEEKSGEILNKLDQHPHVDGTENGSITKRL